MLKQIIQFVKWDMSLTHLSKYRTQLMGVACLWIVLFHSSIVIPSGYTLFSGIKITGYGGVDIFFLLSGVGVAFSLTNSQSIASFYQKRLIRIIPTFWIFLLFVNARGYLSSDVDVTRLWYSFSGLDFLMYGKLKYWFIPSILLCYLVAPLYGYVSGLFRNWLVLLVFSVPLFCCSWALASTPFSYLLIFIIRIPVFFFGMTIGLLLAQKEDNRVLANFFVNAVVFVVAFVLLLKLISLTTGRFRWQTGLWWYPTIVMALPVSMLSSFVLENTRKILPVISGVLHYFGKHSLEIYLIHVVIFDLAKTLPFDQLKWNYLRAPENLICILITLLLSILLKFTANTFISFCLMTKQR